MHGRLCWLGNCRRRGRDHLRWLGDCRRGRSRDKERLCWLERCHRRRGYGHRHRRHKRRDRLPEVGVVERPHWNLASLHCGDTGRRSHGRGGRTERDEVPGQAGSLLKDDDLVVDRALAGPRGEVVDLQRIPRVGRHHRHKMCIVRMVVGGWPGTTQEN